jgi:uncharacterized protein
MPLLAISANDIDIAGLPVDAPLPVDWLAAALADTGVTPDGPGRFQGRLSRSGAADIVVRGRFQASVTTPCARCLSPARIPVDTELSLLLRPEGRKAAPGQKEKEKEKEKEPEYEFTAHEADLDVYDGETVVLDPFLREAILLEMPNFPLCSEACPGIRPAASAASEPPAEERPASIADLRDRFAQRSGRRSPPQLRPGWRPGAAPADDTRKKTKKE